MIDQIEVEIANFSKNNYNVEKIRGIHYDGVEQVYLLNFTFTKTLFQKKLHITFPNASRLYDMYGIPMDQDETHLVIDMENVEIITEAEKTFLMASMDSIWAMALLVLTLIVMLYIGRQLAKIWNVID